MLRFPMLLIASIALLSPVAGQEAPKPQLPPGRHALLERFTAQFGLTYDQQLQIEPLLHNEESVSKPLLRFTAFSPEEKQEVMLRIKLAARRQIRTLLTPDQQKKMDEEIESVSKGGAKAPKSNSRAGSKKVEGPIDPFESEESLSLAISNYAALAAEEKKAMILKVKLAARRATDPQLTPDQQKKLDADIQVLSKEGGKS